MWHRSTLINDRLNFHSCKYTKQLLFKSLPAGESLAAASIDTLGQGVLQSGIDHIQTDGLQVDFTARIPAASRWEQKLLHQVHRTGRLIEPHQRDS